MHRTKLPNYLRTYRKRSYFSQDEVAFLLGCKNGSKVSRYENFSRRPTPETIFAYEIIFRVPVRELFAGIYQNVEGDVLRRAQLLVRKAPAVNPDRITSRKLQALRAISGPETGPRRHS
jgi:transcriptional regulator with XRE-family HTH domain